MYYFQVTIAYKGTAYFGWQAQSTDTLYEEKPTIEGTILSRLKKMTHYQPCTVSGASRTDGGVHALGQIAKLTISKDISPEKLLLGLNSILPDDIRILTCRPSTKQYQPSKSSISKEYHYYFVTSPIDNVTTSDIAMHLPISNPDDLALLRSACKLFVGRHDFYNFSSRDKGITSSTREIFHCDIHQASFSPLADELYYLKIIGNGFLKYMVRYLMGTLYELAKGRISLDDISRYLDQHQTDKLSARAKPKGLHLINIEQQV
ncbi:tRNA pseudouridine(38-40) synthase TruA [Pelagibaculum spongiae]|uniref:tRNA pseudouridine synthase A n=1 Tax=Pelagibaculum spongiae TaxID=2080658 RepID=A0A2V1GT79_9GAMM|nr:tRNA pseudouridine(38-40) synthase TruA [Pelagibaculum spongiae]PVZ66817.1 tRNA pseudouridine(38-40) synthase TruA [Pelagibaculum spongiae]